MTKESQYFGLSRLTTAMQKRTRMFTLIATKTQYFSLLLGTMQR